MAGRPQVSISRSWLVKHYVEQRLTSKECAEILGCGQTTILKRLKEHGIPLRTSGDYNQREHFVVDGRKHKQCNSCSRVLELSEFCTDKHAWDGLTSQCKACRNAKKQEYRENNQENIRRWHKEENARAKERRRAERQRYYEEHKEEIEAEKERRNRESRVKRRLYYYRNHEKSKRQCRESYHRTKDDRREALRLQWRLQRHKRKALERNQIATLAAEEWNECLEYFSHQCAYCGTRDTNLTQDHIVPLAKGGHYVKWNIVPACASCNFSKKAAPCVEWFRAQSFYRPERLKRIRNWISQNRQPSLFAAS